MKVKDLVKELSEYDGNAELEFGITAAGGGYVSIDTVVTVLHDDPSRGVLMLAVDKKIARALV